MRELTLEHYPGMTEKALARIVEAAAARWEESLDSNQTIRVSAMTV